MVRKADKNSAFAAQQKLAMIQLLGELPNYAWLVISAIVSKSLLVWMDLIDSTNILFRAIFVMALSGKLKKNLSYQYNYGTGKVEAVASLCCDMLLLVSLAAAVWFGINKLMHPQQPSGMLFLVVLLKMENVIFDVFVLIKQRKNRVDSSLFRAEYASNLKNLVFDSSMFLIFVVTFFLRNYTWSWYLSPIFSLIFAAAFAYFTVVRMRRAIVELMDTTCDEQTQRNIIKVLVALYDQYDEFLEVKSRVNADQLIIDIYLRFRPETTYEQIEQFTQTASEKMKELNPNSLVSVVIRES